ncbi:glycosyltransferase family 2 protein [Loigolactobacillus backii]|uniref:glycosyltransferase family 2 protein n=1 Tax=Loigolactobacillus backii TaxID=375175 RepID=UPI0022FD47D2|nr:glycosyltransferase family 2 protein [Loigolactobacillus backii]MDA5388289.1 glycosyltransferase family 2 protein [Loigolactobacillus backii]MDA5390783.1 glycosyltransferase family 2 protein [Loigolactobacillus backii]
MKKVGIIILNYNNARATIKCVQNVASINYDNYFIVVVDNNSTDNSYRMLIENLHGETCLIKTKRNGGYAYGNNVGIRNALDKGCDYVFILNNDVILEGNTLKALVDYNNLHPNVGIIGPALLEFKNKSFVQSTGANNNLLTGNSELLNNGKSFATLNQTPLHPDYLGGSCILVRRDAIQRTGLIPENYFLFYEENEWCLNFKKQGYDVVCLPDIKVYHVGSESINQVSGLSHYYMTRNKIIFEKRNADRHQFIFFILYTFFRTILRSIKHPKYWKDFSFYFDGLFNRNKYDYLQSK